MVDDLWTALTRDGLLSAADLRSALAWAEGGLPPDAAIVKAARLDGPGRGRLRALIAARAGLPPASPERLERATLADAAHLPAAWRDQRGLVCIGADAMSLEVVCAPSAASLLPELAFTLGRRISATLALSDEVEATRARLDIDSVLATGATAMTGGAAPAVPSWVEAWLQLAEASVDEGALLEALSRREIVGLDAWLLLAADPTWEANCWNYRWFAAFPAPLRADLPLTLPAEAALARTLARGAAQVGPARGDEGLSHLCTQLGWAVPDDVFVAPVTRPHAATPTAHFIGLRAHGPVDGATLGALRRLMERLGAAWPTQRRVTAPIASLAVAEPQHEVVPSATLHTLQGMPVAALIERAQRSVVFGERLQAPNDTILELRPLSLADFTASPLNASPPAPPSDPTPDPLDALQTRPHIRAVLVADEPELPQVRATRTVEPAPATSLDAPALRLAPQAPRTTGPVAVTETQLELAVRSLSQANPEALARAEAVLLAAGEAGLDTLVAAFPGQLVIDRFAHPVGSVPFERHSGLLRAFARFGPLAVPRLEALSRHLSPEIRYYALYALTALRTTAASDLALERLADADPGVRDVALFVLDSARGTPQFADVAQRLRAQVSAGPPRARRAALDSLARLRLSEALPEIVPLLEDASLGLQDAAHRALVDLTRTDLGFEAWKWTRWWGRNQSRPRMEWLIDALLHEQRAIRAGALTELRRATHQNYGYVVDAPPAERKAGWARWTRWWSEHGRARFEGYR